MGPQTGSLELVTAPATEPVTVAEAKAHARIETSADDALLGAYITAARQLLEKTTGLALISQTWKLVLDTWPGLGRDEWWDGVREMPENALAGGNVEIRKAPFLAVTSVVTLDEADAPTTWAASNYYVTKRHGFGHIVKKAGAVWPILTIRSDGAIVITFTAGYGPNASDVPMAIRQALKMTVAHWYENREAVGENMQEIPQGAMVLLRQYTVAR
jgi:uncharacterized phiE125 gp8 family phage protein